MRKLKHKLCGAVGLALLVLFAFNLALAWRLDSVAGVMLRDLRRSPPVDLLFVGNSLVASGVDARLIAKARPFGASSVFNLGLGSSSPVEHDLLVRQAYQLQPTIKCLIYGFFDLDLTIDPRGGWSDLIGNRAMDYFVEPARAAEFYAPGSAFEVGRFRLIGAVPMLRQHSQLWKYVEQLRRQLEEVGRFKAGTTKFGRVADFRGLELPAQPAFDQACSAAVDQHRPLTRAIEDILQLASAHKTKPVVVLMPMTLDHRRWCYGTPAWQRYSRYVSGMLRAEGVDYIDASDWVMSDQDFSDGLHLRPRGAEQFSTRIAKVIAALQ